LSDLTFRQCAANFADLQKDCAVNAIWSAAVAGLSIVGAFGASRLSPFYVAMAIMSGLITAANVRDCDEAADLWAEADILADEAGEP
jgi:hypothetical protein